MKTLKRGVKLGVCVFLPKIFNLFVILSLIFQPVGSAGVWDVVLAQSTDPATDVVADVPADEPVVETAPAVETSEPAPVAETAPADEPVAEEPAPIEEATPVTEEETAPADTTLAPTPSIGDTGATTDIPSNVEDTTTLPSDEDVPVVINPETSTLTEESIPAETPVLTSFDTTTTPVAESPETSEVTDISTETNIVVPTEEVPATLAVPLVEEVQPATLVVADEPVDETVCLAASVTGDSEGNWTIDEANNTAVTNDPVQLGVRYVYPLDKEVTITFTCLPKDESKRAPLKIERIKASDINLPTGTIAVSEYAYDITTDGMENGSFKYDLTLPKYEGVKDADISYIEMSAEEVTSGEIKKKDIKQVADENVDNKSESVEVTELDHFTIVFPSVNVVCQNDVNGVNDFAGQKDLTMMCRNTDVSANIFTKWNWDDISWSGNNTGDACNLFDTNNNGDVDYAVCVTIGGSPAVIQSTTRYSCSDGKPDRCTNPTTLSVSPNTSCEVSTSSTDPFAGGNASPSDTQAICDIDLDDVGGSTSAKLIDVCSYPSQEPNSDPSDCIIATQAQTGFLEVVKDLVPSSDIGLFNLSVDGSVLATGVGDGGTTGEQVVLASGGSGIAHTFGEAGNGGTNLSDYNTSVVCRDTNGTGNIVSTTGTNPWTINVVKDEDIVCTITNTLKTGTITIIKNAVPDDAQDFAFTTTGTGLSSFSLDDDADGTLSNTKVFNNLSAGTYSVAETVPTGWTQTSATCSDQSPVSAISLQVGENVTCTFTNTKDPALLTLVKEVNNDDGGNEVASAWTLTATGPTSISGVTGNVSVTNAIVIPGTYTLSESVGPDGYFIQGWICDGGTLVNNVVDGVVVSGTLTLSAGQNVTCTIINSDSKPSLALVKNVVNDNGGTAVANDFNIKLNDVVQDFVFLDPPVNNISTYVAISDVLANTEYTLTEADLPGYVEGTWSCVDDYNNQDPVAHPFTMNEGQSFTCTITNNDIAPVNASLTLVKEVVNDNGGNQVDTDWTLSATGPTSISGVEGNLAVTNAIVSPGVYTLSESGPTGYFDYGWTCNGGVLVNNVVDNKIIGTLTLSAGDIATCKIINDDFEPLLTLVKNVVNDNGGTAVANDFNIKLNDVVQDFVFLDPLIGGGATYIASPIVSANTLYTLTEDDLDGYVEGTWSCVDDYNNQAPVAHPFTMNEGQSFTCTITNDDQAAALTVIKNVVNDNGGTKVATDFTMNVTGTDVSNPSFAGSETGTIVTLDAGSYSVDEGSVLGYAKTLGANCSGTIALGESKTCTITNDDIRPQLTVIKIVTNDNGGNLNPSDFTINVSGTNVSPSSFLGSAGQLVALDAGNYNVTETLVSGYVPQYSSDCTGSIAVGETKTCTITNDDQVQTLTLVKTVINDNGGTKVVSDFPLFINSNPVTSGVPVALAANTQYTASETNLSGYLASSWGGDCAADGTITLLPGQNKTCTITNNDIQPKLTVTKVVVNEGFGTKVVSDFPLFVDQTSVTSGVQNGFNAGSYIVSETQQTGYTGVISGDCAANGSVTLAVGDVKACTITNNDALGKIIVEKQTLPDGSTQTFEFNPSWSTDNFLLADGQTNTSPALSAGTYSVSEIVPNGWDQTSATCSDQSDVNAISLQDGETVTCVFTNTKRGHVIIKKNAIDDSQQAFTFNNNFGNNNPATFNLTDDATPGLPSYDAEVLPGTYIVTENPVTGWQQESATCDSGETIGSIDVAPGETVTCTFVNEELATIVLVKNTVGGNDTFDFDATGAGLSADIDLVTVEGTASQTFDDLDQDNTYSIAENVPVGWDLTSATCTGTNNPASITPDAGETVTCTFTNTKRGTIIVEKQTNPDGDAQSFEFNPSWSEINFILSDGQQNDSGALVPGTYSVAELIPAGWDQASVICSDQSPVDAISLQAGETVTCVFTNTKQGSITVVKNTNSGDGSFNFTSNFGVSNLVTIGGTASQTANNLVPGGYSITETIPDGWDLASVTCSDQSYPNEISLQAGENVTCTFTNTRDTGTIVLHKIIDIDGNTETTEDQTAGVGWEFDVNGTSDGTSNPVPGSTGADGSVVFDNLNTGQYSVTETLQYGYDLIGIVCNVENGPWFGHTVSEILVFKDYTTECTFINSPNGSIHGFKWNDENGNGESIFEEEPRLAGWTINLYQWDDEAEEYSFIDSTVTDSSSEHFGWYWFEHLFPGEYKICEVLQDGWNQTYPNNEGEHCHFLFLPDDNSYGFKETQNAVFGPEYNFGNQFIPRIPPVLQISKTNDSSSPENPGNGVTYTITVTAPEGNTTDVEDVIVTDLPPEGFEFVAGSDVASQGSLTSAYASPGVWSLGTMTPGQTITLSYQVAISGSQDAGNYNDLAFARGTSVVGADVLAEDPEDTDNFVGTDVEVVLPVAPANVALTNIVERDVDTKTIHKTKKVLGAATVLPSTGSNINTILSALMLLLGGLILLLLGKQSTWNLIKSLSKSMIKAVKVALFVIIGILLVSQSASAASGDLNVQIEQPKAVINSPEIKVGFVVLDISAEDDIDVECEVAYEAGPFGEFDTYTIAAGGTSGDCDVNAADMPLDGTYIFRVTAEEQEGDSDIATAAPIELVSGTPSTPLDYSRAEGSCTASFTTSNDGLTDKVELYRSTSSTFTANSSTLVATSVSIGPNAASTLTGPLSNCGDNFYAIRAVALSGLGSGFVGDENVTVDHENKIKTKTDTKKVAGPVTTLGAIPVSGGEAPTGAVEGAATDEEAVTPPSAEQEGFVLGSATEAAGAAAGGLIDWIKNHPWWSLFWLLVIFLIAYFVRRIYFGNYNANDSQR